MFCPECLVNVDGDIAACKMFLAYFALLLCSLAAETSSIIFKEVSRSIDISTQLVVIHYNITLLNQQDVSVNKIEFITEPDVNGTLAYIGAKTGSVLNVVKHESNWHVVLKNALLPGEQTKLSLTSVYINSLVPYPTHIRQHDAQLVIFYGNIFFYSPYFVEKQITFIHTPTKRLESYTMFEPVSQFDTYIVYGPYQNINPHCFKELKVHYENNAPFLVVTNLKRDIEVSHWGNIAVEQFVELEHRGAILKGPFSRSDYELNEQNGLSSIWRFVTVLPPTAKDFYYKDLIGNVSSSQVEYFTHAVHLHLQMRFPLFGGWKIKYIFGYNLPSHEFLYSEGNNFMLRMDIIDNIFKNMVVEKMQTQVALPEYSADLQISTDDAVGNYTYGKHYTYLDVVGRPTVQFTGYNLVEYHINTFDLQYTFPYKVMLLEPLYLCIAIFICFAVYLLVSRLHFDINKKEETVKKRFKRFKHKNE